MTINYAELPQCQPRIDPQRYVELRRDGLSIAEISKRLKVSERTVSRWLVRLLGDTWQTAAPPATPEQQARVVQLASDGVPDGWIAEEVKLSQRTVGAIRQAAGIQRTDEWKRVRLSIQSDNELFDLHRQFAPAALSRG